MTSFKFYIRLQNAPHWQQFAKSKATTVGFMNPATHAGRKFKAKMVTFGATIVMFHPLPLLQGNTLYMVDCCLKMKTQTNRNICLKF